jgi:hypothetical protein
MPARAGTAQKRHEARRRSGAAALRRLPGAGAAAPEPLLLALLPLQRQPAADAPLRGWQRSRRRNASLVVMTRRIVHAIKVELDAWLGGQRGSGGVAVPAAALEV